MSQQNDFVLGSTIRFLFNTVNQNRVPTTPSVGMAFAIYKGSSVTEYTLPGANVVTDFDGLAGFHRVTIDTSSDPFFVVGEDYTVVFTAGTVDTVDLTRRTLFQFSLENRNTKANITQIAGQTVNAAGAVTFPSTVASPTNITQATGITLAATTHTGAIIPTVTDVTTKSGYSLSSAGVQAIWDFLTSGILVVGSIGKLLVDRIDATISSRSTYAGGDTPGTLTLLSRLTGPRASNLDFLDAASSSILSSISGLNNLSAKCNLFGSALLEVPETGSITYAFDLVVKDDEDKLVNLDAVPVITATNALGTNRSANLSSVTSPGTGRYRFTYTVASTHVKENLRIEASGTVSSETRYAIWNGSVVDYDTTSTLVAIQNNTVDIQSRLPSTLVNGRIPSYVGEMAPSVITASSIATSALDGKGNWALVTDWTATRAGFLDLVLLANNTNQRTITLTGNGHVPGVIHSVEPNAIPENAFQTDALSARVLNSDAVTEIVTGVWTRDLSTFGPNTAGKTVTDISTGISTLLSRVISGTAELINDLRTMIVNTGLATVRWSASALQNGPSGSGGGGPIIATVAVPQILENTAFNVNEIVMYRGCYWSFQIEDLGNLSGFVEIWFSLRKRQNDKESDSALLISLTQGLLIANSSIAQDSSKGSLTFTGEDVTIQVHQDITQYIAPSDNYSYDIKGKTQAGQTVMLHESELFRVKRDITRRV